MSKKQSFRSKAPTALYRRRALDVAVSACLFAARMASAADATVGPVNSMEDTGASSGGLAEITVTAQRRAESIQAVPITVEALTGDALSQLNVSNVDDFIKYLPNVTLPSVGPAQGEFVIRGLSVGGGTGGQGIGSTSPFPAVAIYLDEQSGQLPGRNLDVYAADLQRIEVLEGPQGTLFGGGALSGAIRYITNKPKLDITEGSVEAAYGPTAHGDPNSSVTAVLNLPLIEDTLAVRGVIYDDRRGGYINNLPATFSRAGTDLGLTRYNNGVVPTNSSTVNNNNFLGSAINPLTYTGARLEVLWKINENWNALLTQSYQNMDAEGVFYDMPNGIEGSYLTSAGLPVGGVSLPNLSVNTFNPSYDKDRFENTALVVNGNIGGLKLIYSGAYLVRNVDQVQDYTAYARGVYGYYYQCAGYSSNPATGLCATPSSTWKEHENNTHQSHELRLSTPDDERIRGLVGVYWEKYSILDQTEFDYKTLPNCSPTADVNCFNPIVPFPGSPPYTLDPSAAFIDDVYRQYKQLAEFASVDVDLIPKVLTVTAGIRHFQYESSEYGTALGSFYCKAFSPTTYFGPCQQPSGTNFNLDPPRSSESGNRGRVAVTWHITPHDMVYYTYSQGFRPGIFNTTTSCHLPGSDGINQYCDPAATLSDNVTNNEIGWKTEWFDRVVFNGSIYQEAWGNAQVNFFDPQAGLGYAFSANGPSYRVRGFEPQIIAKIVDGLTFQASAAWNSSSQTNSPSLVDDNPASINYGKAITSIQNPYGTVGSPTAFSPPFNVNARLRYAWTAGDYQPYVQFAGQHRAHEYTGTGYAQAYDVPGITTYDASVGVSKSNWNLELFCQNLTDNTGPQSISKAEFVYMEFPTRPRVIELKMSYKFAGNN
jgi:outer membrane receptor protein involved in Fe transport